MSPGIPQANVARPALSPRARVALAAGRAAKGLSRALGKGEGGVIGGGVALKLHPRALEDLAEGREIALVSATNGKSTTTQFLAAALATAGPDRAQPRRLEHGQRPRRGARRGARRAARRARGRRGLPRAHHRRRRAALHHAHEPEPRAHPRRELQARGAALARDRSRAWVPAAPSSPTPTTRSSPGRCSRRPTSSGSPAASSGGRTRWCAAAAFCRSLGGRRPTAATAAGSTRPEPAWRLEDGTSIHGPHGSVAARRPPAGARQPGQRPVRRGTAAALRRRPGGGDGGDRRHRGRRRALPRVRRRRPARAPSHGEEQRAAGTRPSGSSPRTARPALVFALDGFGLTGRDTATTWDAPVELLAGRQAVASGERRDDVAARLEVAGVEVTTVADHLEAIRACPPGPVHVVANYPPSTCSGSGWRHDRPRRPAPHRQRLPGADAAPGATTATSSCSPTGRALRGIDVETRTVHCGDEPAAGRRLRHRRPRGRGPGRARPLAGLRRPSCAAPSRPARPCSPSTAATRCSASASPSRTAPRGTASACSTSARAAGRPGSTAPSSRGRTTPRPPRRSAATRATTASPSSGPASLPSADLEIGHGNAGGERARRRRRRRPRRRHLPPRAGAGAQPRARRPAPRPRPRPRPRAAAGLVRRGVPPGDASTRPATGSGAAGRT